MALDTIADRYAEAYFAQSRDDGRLPEALAELRVLGRAVADVPPLAAFLANPEIEPPEKRALLRRACGALSAQTLDLVDLLVANGRSNHLDGVAEAFQERWLASQGVRRAVIESARALPPALVVQIRERLERVTRVRLEVDAQVEPSLIGGVRVRIGHQEYDGSLRRKLRDVKTAWLAAAST